MYKIRILLMSALLFLLVGVNTYVRASVDSGELVQKASDKEQSDKDSQDQEPKETISHLDFFGAFSLVNTQLQWRDLQSGQNDKSTEVELSVNRKELPSEVIETLSFEDNGQDVPTSSFINNANTVVPTSTYRTIDGSTHFTCSQNKQRSNTIAYILNCSTKPLSC